MQRLSQLHEDIVGDVHQIVDGPQPDRFQPRTQPRGRRADPDVPDDSGSISGTSLGIVDSHGTDIVNGRSSLGKGNLGIAERLLADCRHLSRHSEDRQAVAAVGRHGNIEDLIVKAERLAEGNPGGRILREFPQAAGIFSQAEFALRAEHPAGTLAPNLRLLNGRAARQGGPGQCQRNDHPLPHVGCATYDRDTVPAVENLAQMQAFGTRMRSQGLDPCRHHPLHTAVGTVNRFHFKPDHRQTMGQFLARKSDFHIVP